MLSIAELNDNLRSDGTLSWVRNKPLKRRAESSARQVGVATQPTNWHRSLPGLHAGNQSVSSKSNYSLFTSESVSVCHPDQVADLSFVSVLGCIVTQDLSARVAVDTLCNTRLVVLAG